MSKAKTRPLRLLSIGCSRALAERALALGADLFVVHRESKIQQLVGLGISRMLVWNFEKDDDYLDILERLHAAQPFDGILSLAETALLPTARAAARRGLRCNSVDVVEATVDKAKMRERLHSRGFSPLATSLGRGIEQVRSFGDAHGYPIVVKPRDGSGSAGVRILEIPPDDSQAAQYEAELLLEEFVDGSEFSVEAISREGRARTFGVVQKGLFGGHAGANAHVELSHQFPASLSAEQTREVETFVETFLGVMGITEGPTHTELKWGARGLRIIETHTRLGGDFIQELVRRSTGVDLIGAAAAAALGLPAPELDAAPTLRSGAAIRYFAPRPGTVRAIVGLERWQGEPGIARIELHLSPGDVVARVESSADRVGYVIATAESGEGALRLCERVTDGLRIQTA